ncbi:MAG: YciI family protein [Pseudomonadota bacterium]
MKIPSTKLTVFVLLAWVFAFGLIASAVTYESESEASAFDAELAETLGADAYGMRQYVMAFLKAGPNQEGDPEDIQAIQDGHMAYIRAMAEDGTLAMAGPFMDGGELRGIFIFAVDSLEEAEALTAADPAVQAGRLVMELKPWYGSAALMKVGEIHQQIAQSNP